MVFATASACPVGPSGVRTGRTPLGDPRGLLEPRWRSHGGPLWRRGVDPHGGTERSPTGTGPSTPRPHRAPSTEHRAPPTGTADRHRAKSPTSRPSEIPDRSVRRSATPKRATTRQTFDESLRPQRGATDNEATDNEATDNEATDNEATATGPGQRGTRAAPLAEVAAARHALHGASGPGGLWRRLSHHAVVVRTVETFSTRTSGPPPPVDIPPAGCRRP
jgi:hypothetical protein